MKPCISTSKYAKQEDHVIANLALAHLTETHALLESKCTASWESLKKMSAKLKIDLHFKCKLSSTWTSNSEDIYRGGDRIVVSSRRKGGERRAVGQGFASVNASLLCI